VGALIRTAALVSALATTLCGPAALAARSRLADGQASTGSTGTIRIWPLGDSITRGYSMDNKTPERISTAPGGYRQALDLLLTERLVSHQFVGTSQQNSTPLLQAENQQWHDGHDNYRIDQVLDDLTGIAGAPTDAGGHWLTGLPDRAPVQADVVIINLGVNDIGQRFDPGRRFAGPHVNLANARERTIFVADLVRRLRSLVEIMHRLRPRMRFVVSNLVPLNNAMLGATVRVAATDIKAMVAAENQKGRVVAYADILSALVEQGTYKPRTAMMTSDGTHPTAVGYDVMAGVYADAVQAVLSR
jgi:lysophospholipase L1-like esterase